MNDLLNILKKVNKIRDYTDILTARGISITNMCLRKPLCFYCNYVNEKIFKKTVNEIIEKVRQLILEGIDRVTLASGWLGYENNEGIPYIKAIKKELPDLKLSAAFGPISREILKRLKEAGLDQYSCNLESTPLILPRIKGVSDFRQRLKTLNEAREVGLEVSTGFIIGVGETYKELDLLLDYIKELDPESVFLTPFIPYSKTKMAYYPRPSIRKIITTIAKTRLILRDKTIGFRIYRNGGFYPPQIVNLAIFSGANLIAPSMREISKNFEEIPINLKKYSKEMEKVIADFSSYMISKKETEEFINLMKKIDKIL